MSTQTGLESLLAQRQRRLTIVATTRTPSGKTLDWVPIESQTTDGEIATPPPALLPSGQRDPERQTHGVSFEMHDLAVGERGPTGTVPILRPHAEALAVGPKKGGILVNRQRAHGILDLRDETTDPNPFRYFHCTASQSTTTYGLDTTLNVWNPTVGGPGDDHSISQVWLQNYDKPQAQSVEAGWTIDRALNGDTVAHVFTYFTANGYTSDADNVGGYNQLHKGWVQYDANLHPGVKINGTSTYGGGQLEVSIKFQLWQGNWWFALQNIWLGYYPGGLFGGGIGDHVSWNGFGGEVYSSASNPQTTTDQMGSGHKAEAGWTRAAYQRLMRLQTDRNGGMANAASLGTSTDTSSGAAGNYDMAYTANGGNWGSYFFYGGPSA
ncbi:MAG TPA: neprosin family prolyl endopeptidase [Frankiaceae bacterium]|nr:neprosin family prolyl endopeptidase [Frankiaceae bacterium]